MRNYILLLFLTVFFVQGCSDMDDTYKEYVVPGGITYPGKATAPKVHPGRNRIQFSWLKGTDPRVEKARIFWNNYTDSVSFDIPAADTIFYLLEDLQENTYSFFIRTYDEEDNVSIPVEILGSVYGEKYQESLLDRALIAGEIDEDGKLTILWGNADLTNGAVSTEVRYTNAEGKQAVVKTSVDETSTEIPDFTGDSYEYRTLFLPDTMAIDTFYTTFTKWNEPMKISKKNWIATADTYEPSGQLPAGGPPEFAIDDDPDTYWHTNHTTDTRDYPHWLAFDMRKKVVVARVELTSRSDYLNADFHNFRIEGRNSEEEEWISYGQFFLPDILGPQSFELEGSPMMQYIRIYMIDGAQGQHTHLAEFSVYGSYVE